MNTTITEKSILLSKKGMKELKRAIVQLERDHHKALQVLREIDKTSNREDNLIRIDKLSIIEGIEADLMDKKSILSSAKLLPTKRNRLQVAIGSVVDLIDKHGHLFRYTIVDSIEADPSDGRISTASPLGRNLIGRTVQDIIQWRNGEYFNQFQLVRIM
jgi:transcription elongation factor GreA